MNNKTFQFSCMKEKCNREHLNKQYYQLIDNSASETVVKDHIDRTMPAHM